MISWILTFLLAAFIIAPGLFRLRGRPRLRWALVGLVLLVYVGFLWAANRPGGTFARDPAPEQADSAGARP